MQVGLIHFERTQTMITIGIGANWDPVRKRINMPNDYITAVIRAGALPVLLPLTDNQPVWDAMVDSFDAMILPGGEDIEPSLYGEETLPNCGEIIPERDRQELYTFGRLLASGKPFLAICRGIQLVNVFAGGTLYQDIASQVNTEINHAQFDIGSEHIHTVQLAEGSLIRSVAGETPFGVNSRHHQAVKTLGKGLKATAISPDGLIEAVEYADGYPGIAVQWHPENLAEKSAGAQALFDWLVKTAASAR
jgi:putative glutamine amidotransferase